MGEAAFHVLLIGIDGYPGPNPAPLGGCINDIDALERVLLKRFGIPSSSIVRLESPLGDPSKARGRSAARRNIIVALQNLAGDRVGPEDKVLIAYSGHGASVSTSDTQGVVLREALVPVDASVDAAGPKNLLFDVQLNELLRKITERTRQVTCLFDCCHSSSLTRGLEPGGASAKHGAPAPRWMPIRGVYSPEQLGLQSVTTRGARGASAPVSLAGSVEQCVVAAACLPDESAMEQTEEDGRRNGLFTRALVRQLEAIDAKRLPNLRWGSIWRQVVAEVESRQPQHPRLMGSFARRVLGGPPEEGDTGFGVRYEVGVYRVDAGELAGVTVGAKVAVYGSEPPILPPLSDTKAEQQARKGTLVITSARRSWAEAIPAPESKPFDVVPDARGRVVKPGREAQLVVAIDPGEGVYPVAVKAIEPALYRFAEPGERPTMILKECQNGDWALTDDLHGPGDSPDEPWLARAPGNEPALAAEMLQHYATYIAPWEMAKRCSDLQPGTLRVSLLDCRDRETDKDGIITDVDPQSPNLPALPPQAGGSYEVRADDDLFCYEIRNHHSRPLFVTLIECGASGRVNILGQSDMEVPANGRYVVWWESTPGKPILSSIPGHKPVGIDRIVAIGTTAKDKDLKFLSTSRTFADFRSVSRDSESAGRTRDSGPRYPATERWIADRIIIRAKSA